MNDDVYKLRAAEELRELNMGQYPRFKVLDDIEALNTGKYRPSTEERGRDGEIKIIPGQLPQMARAGLDALDRASVPFYQRGGELVRVCRFPSKASDGAIIQVPAVKSVEKALLRVKLTEASQWLKWHSGAREFRNVDAPGDIVEAILGLTDEWPFKPLSGIIGTPTLRPNGSLLINPGYDEQTGYYLFGPPPMPEIPENPSEDEARAALGLLMDLLAEFPFVDGASRAVALSMLMTPVLRPALAPAVPLHAVVSPAAGSGKSFLTDLAATLATGERAPVIARAPRVEETEKRLIAAVLAGHPIVSIDNCNGVLEGEFLCQMIERPLLTLRPLGTSEPRQLTNGMTLFGNGNNIEIPADLVRRAVQCSLDANVERPFERKFRGDPMAAIKADRGRYVAAVLTIARYGIGAPAEELLSFSGWSRYVRAPLMRLGCGDPVETTRALAEADPVQQDTAAIFGLLAGVEGAARGLTSTDIISAAADNPELERALLGVASGKGDELISDKRLGWWLRSHRNLIAGDVKLTNDVRHKQNVWYFTSVLPGV